MRLIMKKPLVFSPFCFQADEVIDLSLEIYSCEESNIHCETCQSNRTFARVYAGGCRTNICSCIFVIIEDKEEAH